MLFQWSFDTEMFRRRDGDCTHKIHAFIAFSFIEKGSQGFLPNGSDTMMAAGRERSLALIWQSALAVG
jgi:hypothetical protein